MYIVPNVIQLLGLVKILDSNMLTQIKLPSLINYNYSTIKMTRSRIEYGLLAIPKSILFLFPKKSSDLLIYFDNSKILRKKSFVISEKNRESRVYGLSEWYNNNKFREDDEIIIQLINYEEKIYRFIAEKRFVELNTKLQKKFDKSINEKDAESHLLKLSEWNVIDSEHAALREMYRLSMENFIGRKNKIKNNIKSKELVPPRQRILLTNIYKGVCQVCKFWFLKKDNHPYFEIHHLDASIGNHPKNLIVVCSNCHKQFEYANVKKEYDKKGWLAEVSFNQNKFYVKQALSELDSEDFAKTVFI